MAKKAEQSKVKSTNGLMLEQNTVYDDSLLPSAEELSKLNDVSEDIIPWIMKRTGMEQDARIKFNDDRMSLAKKDMQHIHRYNFTALIMAFIIAMTFILFSFYLILHEQKVIGTVFAGGTAALIISYFIKAKNNHE